MRDCRLIVDDTIMATNKLIPTLPKYTIVSTGYTDRLIQILGYVRYRVTKDDVVLDVALDHDMDEIHIDEDPSFTPLFITAGWDDKYIYAAENLDVNSYKQDILTLFYQIVKGDGGSAIYPCDLLPSQRCRTSLFLDDLVKVHYCEIYGQPDVQTYFNEEGFFCIHYDCDSESG